MSAEDASNAAVAWCEQNPQWKRICDISDSGSLRVPWEQISPRVRAVYMARHGTDGAQRVWEEFGEHPYRHRFGFVGEDGTFYDRITDLPPGTNSMMVFEVCGRPGVYYSSGCKVTHG